MKTLPRLFVVLTVVATIAGCGDNPTAMIHDLMVLWNEVADNMLRATDESKAKELVKVQFKMLGKKHESIKLRIEEKFKEYGKEDFQLLDDALVDYKSEIDATLKRLDNCQARLDAVIAKVSAAGGDTTDLKKIREWSDKNGDKRKFNERGFLRTFGPDDTRYIEPVKNADFGKGLVPLRPQLKREKKELVIPPAP